MSILRRARTMLGDVRNFGPGFLIHLWASKKPGETVRLPVRGFGSIFVRPADTDIETLRDVLAGRSYDMSFPAALGERIGRKYRAILAAGGLPVVVDAGANIGAASLWFARAFPEAHMVAIEPDDGNAAVLARNLDGRANCTVKKAAIGAQQGFVAVADGDTAHGWAKQTQRATTGVPVITVADAIAGVPNGRPFLVKVDIEGFESDLFSSNLGWLDDMEAVIIEPHDWMKPGERTSFPFQRAMAQHPFELFIRGENLIYARA